METWIDSEEYQQAMDACRHNDRTTVNRIIEERLAAVDGPERAFWLRVRAYQRARDALLPHLVELAWADLEEAGRAAGKDEDVQLNTMAAAFAISLRGEYVDRVYTVLKALRREYRKLTVVPFFWQDMGALNMKRGRWKRAARAFDRAIEGFHSLTEHERGLYACRIIHFHAWRAVCHVACGDNARASADVEAAWSLAAQHPPQNINHLLLGMARAELALQSGELQEARVALQNGMMEDSSFKRPRTAPAQMAETELLAARIARAEGNQVGFQFFCDKALAICRQHRLPLTEARVQAVVAGAER